MIQGRRVVEHLLTGGKAKLPDIHQALGVLDATREAAFGPRTMSVD